MFELEKVKKISFKIACAITERKGMTLQLSSLDCLQCRDHLLSFS